jgi:hypothetical protein
LLFEAFSKILSVPRHARRRRRWAAAAAFDSPGVALDNSLKSQHFVWAWPNQIILLARQCRPLV